ncbi:MAG: phosphoribosylanthranilate isomerase [Blastocatellia bacterium]|nr:phosphoribosylanthranilate isomerase [Blastocatellia bacterium]MCS7158231.1 phosphoribosylanthranilate isomerase [Blastocatellia bacterium]MCX7753069.1 phosphoribosylanthranilate isomerase [Blastocatellia bacterium]MDW8169385.1 phosphoribosylanthranilate isomerase [Acidobacteriota bacterium]MDW8256452.1 phosphoribosylanthranilate isomerase [Acidobacteriota bacterium]
MVRVKICGITNVDDALVAVEAGADALGFIFYPKSPRFITPDRAQAIIEWLPPFVTPVGVFVNEYDLEKMAHVVSEVRLAVVQLHGDEPPAFCQQVAQRWRVIKAVRVGPDFHPHEVAAYPAQAILLDAACAGEYGGTGQRFEWTLARRARSFVSRVILAGGLSPENVAEAIRCARPYAVDVCTGVEAHPGKKDPEKVRAFIAAARAVGVHESSNRGEDADGPILFEGGLS